MVISQDKGKGRVALSTKTLETEPGDMLKNQEKVFEEAEATAAKYQERLEAERKAREEAAQVCAFASDAQPPSHCPSSRYASRPDLTRSAILPTPLPIVSDRCT